MAKGEDTSAAAAAAGRGAVGEGAVGKGASAAAVPRRGLESKQDALFRSLRRFYDAHPEHLRVLTGVLGGPPPSSPGGGHPRVSLRILDWLVTNYAKEHNVVYVLPSGEPFNMFIQYKAQLKAYSKRFFDPFARRERRPFEGDGGRVLDTTVGQLNFFRWALSYGVVAYAEARASVIEEDMLPSIRHRSAPAAPPSEPGAKRRELSKAAIRGCTNTPVAVTVRF